MKETTPGYTYSSNTNMVNRLSSAQNNPNF